MAERELRALASERDPELYFEGLNQLARRLADRDHLAEAGEIWSFVAEASKKNVPESASKARQELNVLSGGGNFGRRVEFFSRRFFKEATRPSALLGMAVGGGVYSLSRGAILSRLLTSPAGIFSRGLGARFAAGIGGFALEAPAFTLATRGLRSAFDEPSGSFPSELAASCLSLGGLRLFGATGKILAGRRPFNPAIQRATAKTSAYLGILAGQGLERSFGLRPSSGIDGALFDALGTWFQAHVGGRMLGATLGPRWNAWQNELQARSEPALRFPKISFLESPSAKPPSGFTSTIAAYGALLCAGCSGSSTAVEYLPWLLGLSGIAALGLRGYLRSLNRENAADAFHALPRKTLADLRTAAPQATGLSAEEVETVLTTVLRYGAPPQGVYISGKRPFQKVAVGVLRLPPVQRRGGIPSSVFHVIPLSEDTRKSFSSITGMPLAYADRIRSWARLNLELPDQWMATPEQVAARMGILTNKIATTFNLPIEKAAVLVELILRQPSGKPGEQKGQLFEGEFPALHDLDGYEFHLWLSRQPAEALLSQAGFSARSISWLKEVIVQLAADCRIPVPSYSMRPNYVRQIGELRPMTEEFTGHDWHAVYRLRDAVWGPWRLPWEEIP